MDTFLWWIKIRLLTLLEFSFALSMTGTSMDDPSDFVAGVVMVDMNRTFVDANSQPQLE
jgi:hypothetical protein